MRVCCLGSGSAGNAVLVEVEGTRVLVDAGFSARDLEDRLCDIGLVPEDPGLWMMHCHILEHAEAGMMTTLEVTPPGR